MHFYSRFASPCSSRAQQGIFGNGFRRNAQACMQRRALRSFFLCLFRSTSAMPTRSMPGRQKPCFSCCPVCRETPPPGACGLAGRRGGNSLAAHRVPHAATLPSKACIPPLLRCCVHLRHSGQSVPHGGHSTQRKTNGRYTKRVSIRVSAQPVALCHLCYTIFPARSDPRSYKRTAYGPLPAEPDHSSRLRRRLSRGPAAPLAMM